MNRHSQWLFEAPFSEIASPDTNFDIGRSYSNNLEWETELERRIPEYQRHRTVIATPSRTSRAQCTPAGTLQRTINGWGQYRQQVKELPANQQKILADVGETIKRSFQPNCQPFRMVQIYGHVDRDLRPEREQQMSRDRALAVMNWLKS